MATGMTLVTGATGFVGANLVRLLLERKRAVRVLARPRSDRRNLPQSPELEIFEGDLRDFNSVRAATRGCDHVFHVAADYRFWCVDPAEIYESNVMGTRHLLEAAYKEGVKKFVHTSTVGTIGLGNPRVPSDENAPVAPGQFKGHYKRSKLEAENLVSEFVNEGLPAVIVNPSTPIGPWDRKPTPTGKIIVDFVNGKMPAYLGTGLNFIHVKDVAGGHILAAEKGRIGERYILGHRNLSMIEFLKLLAERTGRPAPRVKLPYPAAWLLGSVSTFYSDYISKRPPVIPLEAVSMARRYMYFDAGKAVRELGLSQTPIEEAISEAVRWFGENGYIHGKYLKGWENGSANKASDRRRVLHHETKTERKSPVSPGAHA